MSTPLSTSTYELSTPASRTTKAPRWVREPLLHFVILGGLLFGVDHFIASRANDPHTIVVGAEVDKEAKQVFLASTGREPDKKEMEALRRVWLDNEVLYREGLELQVDKGDSAIRDRVIFKALSVVDANVKLPDIDDKRLREWFESHREKYDDPARYNFQEAVLSGDTSESAVRAFVAELNSGKQGDAAAGLRVFKDRPYQNLVQSYGAEFPKVLDGLKPGEWHATQTKDGWRAMRLDSISQPKPAVYEVLRGVVMQDWTDQTAAEQRSATVKQLQKKYKIRYEADAK